jgi:hypothetical protein
MLNGDDAVVASLAAAGFITRRVSFTVRLPGDTTPQRVIFELTGEHALAEELGAIVHDWWVRWGQHRPELRPASGEPVKPIVTRESDDWRLTDHGRLALVPHLVRWAAAVKARQRRRRTHAGREALLRTLAPFPHGETAHTIREKAGLSGKQFTTLIRTLVAEGIVEPCVITKGNRRRYGGYRLTRPKS